MKKRVIFSEMVKEGSLYQSLQAHSLPNRAGIILVSKGKVLLIRRQKTGKEYWTIPGGKIEEGESCFSAACREIFEELAISQENIHFIDSFDIVNMGRKETYFIGEIAYPIEVCIHGEELIRSNSDNIYTPEWIDIAIIKSIKLYPLEVKEKIRCIRDSEKLLYNVQ